MAFSQRENCRWHMLEIQLHHVEKKWGESLDEFDDEYFNFDGEFDATIARKTHSSLIVSGSMVDVYIRELGSMMLSRLSRGKITGIQCSQVGPYFRQKSLFGTF